MAKKKTEKAQEPKETKINRIGNFTKSETTHFVIGLICVIFAVYLLLAFTSFFFTGAADQSILNHEQPGEQPQAFKASRCFLVSPEIHNQRPHNSTTSPGNLSSFEMMSINSSGVSLVV